MFKTVLIGAAIFFAGTDAYAQNRGRIQIQGPDIAGGNISESWSQATPLTKKEGRQRLANLENRLNATQKAARTSALDSAIRFINQCPVAGCSTASKSWPGTAQRVDIEIIEGSAFTGTAPQ